MTWLSGFLAPMTVDSFKSEYFERAPCHFHRREAPLSLNAEDTDALVRATAGAHPHRLRANRGGQVLIPPRGARGDALYDWAVAAYNDGATLVINYIESLDLACGSFARQLGDALGARVSLTVFMTPPYAQGFSPHFDTLDVFVIQVAGSKTWRLGESAIELPTLRQGRLVTYDGRNPRVNSECVLTPGDVLYIPRGVVHWGSTSDEASVHVTADLSGVMVGDLLSAALVDTDVRAKAAVRLGFAQRLAGWEGSISNELANLADGLSINEGLSKFRSDATIQKWRRKG